MKGKATTYILLFLVIAIWAWVMYNVYDYVGDESSNPGLQTGNKKNVIARPIEEKKKYVLKLNYIDLFLKKTIKSFENTNGSQSSYITKVTPNSNTQIKEIIPVVLPEYVGLIANKKGNVAILVFEGKEYMVQEGDEIQNIVLSKIMRDSVKLVVDKKVYYARKNW